jgi:cytochrome c oxidase subunit IV
MERDDIIEYSLDAHHDEEHGKKIRKKIYFVTVLLSVVTVVEVLLGVFGIRALHLPWELIKWTFIILTIVKAGYIVLVFMHLGDERKSFKCTILAPYSLFILYLIFICLKEAMVMYDLRYLFGWN